MTIDDAPHPVELLRDGRGVYGIGVSDLFDLEAIAWSCGIEPELGDFRRPHTLILRPDRFRPLPPYGGYRAVLQKIAGGFRRGPFMRTHEEQLRQFIHHEALKRAGLRWPPRHTQDHRWWSPDKKQQARNRGVYHGLRQLSLHVINHLVGAALEEAANGEAVRAARRFTFKYREKIYRASARSRRALQLTDTFPVLALVLYADHSTRRIDDFKKWETERADEDARRKCATDLVERGARLRDVAGAMGIPMALRRIKPGVAHLVADFCGHPDLLNFIPTTTPRQRIWLPVVNWAINKTNAEFGEWAARHVPEIRGRTEREVGNFLADIVDWARPDKDGNEFITRPFTPSMSLKTVITLSAEWHEAVASNLDGPNSAFPAPWYPAAKLGDYEIIPIENAATLYREGVAMHHCIGSYAARIKAGHFCAYSVRRNGERVASLALGRFEDQTHLEQIRGACNTEPAKAVLALVQRCFKLRAKRTRPL